MRTDTLPIVDCPAGARERGRAHGEALRIVIGEKIGRWHEAIGEAYGEPAASFLARFLTATNFRTAIAEQTPDLLDEVAGIAEGAAIAWETAYALQLMDEEWWFSKSTGEGHCSSLAIAPVGGRPTLVGQTMDLPRWHDGAQALLRIAIEDGYEKLVFTSAGMIGLMGVNGRGIGICVNTLSQLGVSRCGLPVAFVMRGALSKTHANDAADFLLRARHASGQNYQLGDRHGIRTLECSAGGAVELDVDGGRSLHTNHPLKSRDSVYPGVNLSGSENSRGRLASLVADLSEETAPVVDPETVKSALSACRADGAVSIAAGPESPPTESMTIGAVVYEIGETISLSVCAGPPAEESWIQLTPRRG